MERLWSKEIYEKTKMKKMVGEVTLRRGPKIDFERRIRSELEICCCLYFCRDCSWVYFS